MHGVARWIGSPGLAAMLALPLMWSATPPAHVRPAHVRPAHSAAGKQAVPHTIAGSWSFLFGTFDFVRTGTLSTYTDKVIAQRPGVFCPKVNDQNGQIVLHQNKANNWRVYTGTWQWFYPRTCKFAGYGRVTVILRTARPGAFFISYPPTGDLGTANVLTLTRYR